MVKLKEVQNMFWGVTLDGGKRYTQTVERSFHISMAALESSSQPAKSSEKHVSVMIQHEKAEFVMCTLEYGRLYQQPLDLNFTEGEEVTFFLNGTGIVHLTGYLMEEGQYEDEMDLSDMSGESSEEDVPQLLEMESLEEDDSDDEDFDGDAKKASNKRKGNNTSQLKAKKAKMLLQAGDSDDEDDSDDDSDEEIFDMKKLLEGENLDSDDDDEDAELDEEEDDDDDDEDSDEEDQEVPAKSLKQKIQLTKAKQEQKTPSKKGDKTSKDSASTPKTPGQNGVANTPNTEEKKKKKKKKKKKNKKDGQETPNSNTPSTPATPATPNQQVKDTPKKRVFAGGVIVEDVKIGHGPEAKSGRQLHMNYVGTLAQNGKQFDSMKGGKTFKFRLGKGEVIRGWDIGMNGMKVGGKRKLTIPANMAYGKQKLDGIPSNSTLVFDVELKAVS